MKIIAPTKMIIIAIANSTTTGKKEESPVRFSGVGSLREGIGSLILDWMLPSAFVSNCFVLGGEKFNRRYAQRPNDKEAHTGGAESGD